MPFIGTALTPAGSHWIFEVSPIITDANVGQYIYDENFTLVGPQTWTADPNTPNSTTPGANNGNPNLPANLYGVKADTGTDPNTQPPGVAGGTYTFSSTQAPVWGDFYMKDGKQIVITL